MNVYTCTSFTGFNPIGTAAVIIAKNKRQATRLLREELAAIGLKLDDDDVIERVPMKLGAWILESGEY